MIDVKDIDAIIGAEVMDTANDRIGRVSQVYIDSEDQHPSWVSVRTGFFGRSETLIPIDDARWESSTLFVQVDRAKVREAPHVDPDQELSVEEQTALYRYYGKGAPLEADGGEPSATADATPEAPEAGTPSEQAAPDEPDESGPGESVSEQSAPQAALSEPAAEEPHADAVAEDAAAPVEEARDEPAAETESAPAAATAEDSVVEAPGAEPEPQPADEAPVETQEDAVPDQSEPDQAEAAPAESEQADTEPTATATDGSAVLDDGLTAAEPEGGADQAAATEPVSGRRRRSNYVQPEDEGQEDAAAAEATPDQPEVLTRYEERLRIATERVPSSRIRLVKRIVTEHHTVSVPVSHEELHIEREPIGEEEIAAWEGPMSELQEEEREIVLMAERPVVSTHTAPIERIRLVREIVSGTHDVEADLRHEQFDLDRGEQQG